MTTATTTAATKKRAEQSDVIVEATLTALRKYGYAATSLQRIAEEAGTSKRMVLHYFQTRDQLFDEVVRGVCRRVLGQVEQAMAEQPDPPTALTDGLDALWAEIVADPGLHAVFFGLIAESVTDPSHRSTITTVRAEYRELIAGVFAAADNDYPPERLESIATLVAATVAGLTVDFLERGDTPALERAFDHFKKHLATLAAPGAQ